MNLQDALDKFDTMFGSCSRPAIALMCGAAVASSCLIPASAAIGIPVAGGIVMTYMGVRGWENNTKTKAASSDKATSAASDIASQPGATATVDATVKSP